MSYFRTCFSSGHFAVFILTQKNKETGLGESDKQKLMCLLDWILAGQVLDLR
jgi:hypothetical protein